MELRWLLSEEQYKALISMKGRLNNGKKEKQGASTPSRPVSTKTNERRSRVDGQTTTTNKGRRRRGRNENQAKRKEQ